MRSIAKGWSALSLAAGGVVVGFVIAACSVGLGNLGTGGPDALLPAAPTALADPPPRGELTLEERRRIAVIEEASPSGSAPTATSCTDGSSRRPQYSS